MMNLSDQELLYLIILVQETPVRNSQDQELHECLTLELETYGDIVFGDINKTIETWKNNNPHPTRD